MKNAYQFYDFFFFEQTNPVFTNPDPRLQFNVIYFPDILKKGFIK